MLEYFAREGIGATWATVGALACSGWDEYLDRAPPPPAYEDPREGFKHSWRQLDPSGRLHFAPEAIAAIAAAPGQELGSHTFSHICFREAGCSPADVLADSQAVAAAFGEKFGVIPTSFVFPRNQVNYTDALMQAGIERWRTNPKVSCWNATRREEQSRLVRGLRLFDSLAPVGTRRAPSQEMRASYLVRFPLNDRMWKLHMRRIRRDARRLRTGETLHLWWHPHNLGANVEGALRRLAELIDTIREATPTGTRFVSMEESIAPAAMAMGPAPN
jgi:peptidoglycan/xylan/chitin deacetylase (PgdA/CDA1 family)